MHPSKDRGKQYCSLECPGWSYLGCPFERQEWGGYGLWHSVTAPAPEGVLRCAPIDGACFPGCFPRTRYPVDNRYTFNKKELAYFHSQGSVAMQIDEHIAPLIFRLSGIPRSGEANLYQRVNDGLKEGTLSPRKAGIGPVAAVSLPYRC
jgi:hypothetical protein